MDLDSFIKRFKTDFCINFDLSDVKFRHGNIEPYTLIEKDKFGEKNCLLYNATISMYNMNYSLKILSFKYSSHSEILKLEINVNDNILSKEIASCRNFLQRRRNLSLAFNMLLECSRLIEARRLIADVVLEPNPGISLIFEETGLKIKCCNIYSNVMYFDACWSFTWDWVECNVSDFIEFYCNDSEVECATKIKRHLDSLVQLNANFRVKLRVWKALMRDIRHFQQKSYKLIVEITDSDDDSKTNLKTKTKNNTYHEVLIID